jgi:hypothetical protein
VTEVLTLPTTRDRPPVPPVRPPGVPLGVLPSPGDPRLSERRLRSPAGAGRFVAGTVARMQNATALYMNVVDEEFSEVGLPLNGVL